MCDLVLLNFFINIKMVLKLFLNPLHSKKIKVLGVATQFYVSMKYSRKMEWGYTVPSTREGNI